MSSINQYTAGGFDGVTITNMDALSIPAAGGVDTTAMIVGDFSNGNDAVILKDKQELNDIPGQKVNLVEFSVSHYLLARALETVKATEKDLKVVNTSDADMVAAYGAATSRRSSPGIRWSPRSRDPGAHEVFDSSKIPGEIIDIMVVNTEMLKDNPNSARRWSASGTKRSPDDASTPEGRPRRRRWQRRPAPTSTASTRSLPRPQCSSTPPRRSLSPTAANCRRPWTWSASSCSSHGILGKNAKTSVDVVGMSFPDGDHARRCQQRQAPLRPGLHGGGRGQEALTGAAAGQGKAP